MQGAYLLELAFDAAGDLSALSHHCQRPHALAVQAHVLCIALHAKASSHVNAASQHTCTIHVLRCCVECIAGTTAEKVECML